MTICRWVFLESGGLQYGSRKLSPCSTRIYQQKIISLTLVETIWYWKPEDFYMTMLVKIHFIGCPTISICQVVLKLRPTLNSLRQKTSLLWICNEKVLPNASLACIFDLDTSCSVESLSFMQSLDICGSIIWFVVIFIHFHFIMLQNKLFERWIATVAL